MKKWLLLVLSMAVCVGAILWRQRSSSAQNTTSMTTTQQGAIGKLQTGSVAGNAIPLQTINTSSNTTASRELNVTLNPYAAGLRAPGKSKRDWNADQIDQFENAQIGDSVKIELTRGVTAEGRLTTVRHEDGKVYYVSGELTVPESGSFFIIRPPEGGKAGKAAAVFRFPGSETAYRVEPTGANGDPELWERRLDEVICVNMVKMEAAATNNAANGESKEPLNPGDATGYYPSYNVNIEGDQIISLQSLPGSTAVLLLDFFGRNNPDLNYLAPHVSNAEIKDVWKRVAEDYMPFNINVTTDIRVFLNAPRIGKVRIAITPSFAGAGVAGIGEWNLADDYGVHAWSGYVSGKGSAEVCAHEVGHTLGLGHEGLTTTPGGGYYGGQGSGETGWAPTMGVGYYQPLSTWAKGEYTNANNQQNELLIISTANNGVTYRTDDTGNTLATSRYLEIYTNNTAFAEGVIERTADTDAFQFTTTGGVASLTVKPVGDWASLATMATLADATGTVIASNNVQSQVSSTITTNLPAGTYTFRVTGAGKNDPLTDGFSSYASLGYYSVTGSVVGARMPTRLSVVERATNNTVVGSVVAENPNSSPLVYAIGSGNPGGTFSVDSNGVVRVANNTLLDYYRLATNTALYAAQFEVFMNITNVNDPGLTEVNRRVVIAVQQLYPLVPAYVTATADTCLRINLTWVGGQNATSYNVKRGTSVGGPFTTIANLANLSYTDSGLANGVTYYYVVSAVNTNGESANSAVASAKAQAVMGYSFETPNLGGGNFSYNPAGSFWTFSTQAGNSGSGIVANNSGFSNPNAPDGTQAAFVQSYGSITQLLPGFTPGVIYTITYSAAQRGTVQNGGESWNITIDGNIIKTNNPGSTSYTTYTATFTATAPTHTLAFVGTDLAGGDNTVFIDNVRFSPGLQPVPAAVAVTSPANNSASAPAAPVNLTATVTTNGNIIKGVQFYTDNVVLLGQINSSPYTFAWSDVSAGSHTVFARVLFNNGSAADSAPITFTVIYRNLNLGFEIPSLGAGSFSYAPSGGSWSFTESSGASGSGIAANGSSFGNPNAPQGTQAALLQGYGSISQVLSGFSPGTNYTITYSTAQRSGASQHGGESWNVTIDGNVIKTNNPGATSYTTQNATFTATATTHALSFVGTDLAGGDNTVFIDNVSFTPPLVPSLIPDLTTNILPVTALDVVGSQVKFMAAFATTNAISYQWQKIVGGLQLDIPGATTPTLTLSNLQPSDAGLYRLMASNAFGVAVSAASTLTVSNVPSPVNDVVIAYAAQTGQGSTLVNFTPTWSFDPGSLIVGLTPATVGGFGQSIGLLADGSIGFLNFIPNVGLSPTQVTGGSGAGQSAIYTLGSSPNGYSISNIVVYGGWGDAGRDQQAYTVSYSTVAAPATFLPLASVDFNPANPNAIQSATRSTLKPSTGGTLATGVAALKFDFTTPAPENGYCGYSEIAVYGTSLEPSVTQNTLPVTAADVVGSQVTFTAAFSGVAPLSYQWQKISGGTTNNVVGATNATLTLTNLQLANAGSFRLQASNAFGVAFSTAGTLTVSSVPVAVNNVVASFAAQTGTGSGTFTPTWTISTSNSLIAGKTPNSTSGSFTLEVPGRSVSFLTDGGDGALTQINGPGGATTSANYVTCGNGSGAGASVTYTLTGSANGYTLTNITVFGGWKDAGRDQQAYTVYYSKVSSPATFILLRSVNYNPANAAGAQSATRATLSPASGVLATNVAAVKLDFTTPTSENGYCGYAEISLLGTASIPPVVPASLSATVYAGTPGFVMDIGSLVVGRNYTLQSTTNLTPAVWATETNFVATQATAIFTNSTSDAQKFFRLVGY